MTGVIYLLHLNEPYFHAQHYLGWTQSDATLPMRLRHHERGTGAKFMRAVAEAGITYTVALIDPDGTRDDERRLKNRKNARGICPICKEEYLRKTKEYRRRTRRQHPVEEEGRTTCQTTPAKASR